MLKTVVVLIFAIFVTMVLTEPGYGASSQTSTGVSGGGKYGGEHGHESRGGDDHQRHAPGAYDNDDHRQSGSSYSRGGSDRDGGRRSNFDNDRHHAPGAYDNDNHRGGGDYARGSHAHTPGAYDNDNHRSRHSDQSRHSHEGAESEPRGGYGRGGAQAEPRGYGGYKKNGY